MRYQLADILRNSLVWATADLQSTLRAFFKFKSHLNTMATEQHGRDRSTPPKKRSMFFSVQKILNSL